MLGLAPSPSDKARMGVFSKVAFWKSEYAPRSLRRRAIVTLLLAVFSVVPLGVLAVLGMRWIDPPTSAFMIRDAYEALAEGRPGYRLRHYWVDWEHIAPSAKVAVVTAEDQRFLLHDGFDLDSIADAVYERVKGGR